MSFTKVAPAGIGTEPGSSILIGDSLLHSTGIDIGSNTGIGVTIRKHGDATFTGIVTASAFFGDGSGLEGVSSSGIGTPLSDNDTSELNKIYYVNQELSIGSTVTVNHPDSAVASYTHYQDLVVKDDADFIVADGDTFIPDVLGIRTSTSTASAATGGRIRAGTITNAGANGAPNFPNGLTGTAGTFSGAISAASGTITGNLGVGGVLTYEDVTNIDSVGVVTARSGIRIGATGANTLISGTGTGIGIGTATPDSILNLSGTGSDAATRISIKDGGIANVVGRYGSLAFQADVDGTVNGSLINFAIDGSERLRIGSAGQIGIAGANYGTSGQVLTSQGSGSAVQWATPSSGGFTLLNTTTITNNSTSISLSLSSYQHLYGTVTGLVGASALGDCYLRFNSDSGTNYPWHRTYQQGNEGINSTGDRDATSFYFNGVGFAGWPNSQNVHRFTLFDVNSGARKLFEMFSVGDDPSYSGHPLFIMTHGQYKSTSAITSLQLSGSTAFTGGVVKLYGIK